MIISKTHLLLIVLAPLLGSIIAGLFGRQVGRRGAQSATILGVAVGGALSCWVLSRLVAGGAAPCTGSGSACFAGGGSSAHVGFMVAPLTALMMVAVTFVSLLVHV